VGPHLARLRNVAARSRPLRTESIHELRPWESFDAQQAWKDSPEFKERIMRVRQHVDDFVPSVFEYVTSVE
jgi:heme-degrading monooxygenase HmoA